MNLLFRPSPVHLLYPIYFEVLSVWSPEYVSNLSAPLQADGQCGAIFRGTCVSQCPLFLDPRDACSFLTAALQSGWACDLFWLGENILRQGRPASAFFCHSSHGSILLQGRCPKTEAVWIPKLCGDSCFTKPPRHAVGISGTTNKVLLCKATVCVLFMTS